MVEIINWIKEENKGRWNRPNLVAYALIEAMSEKSVDVDKTFAPFDSEAIQVEFKVNGVEVSFTGVMNLIQKAVEEVEDDCKATLVIDAANKLIDELSKKINEEEWKARTSS